MEYYAAIKKETFVSEFGQDIRRASVYSMTDPGWAHSTGQSQRGCENFAWNLFFFTDFQRRCRVWSCGRNVVR